MNDAVWRIELLGGLRVVALHGEPRTVSRFRTQKTAALLAYLALHSARSVSREVVQDALWPNEEQDAGRNFLRVALHSLRKQLEPLGVPHGGVLRADRITLHLNPDACVSDVAIFERLAAQNDKIAALTEAGAFYKGELLPGFYEDWILPERERLHVLFLQTQTELSHLLLDAGKYEPALSAARRAAQTDPHSEEACRLVMQAHARMGSPELARRHFDAWVQQTRQEGGTNPSPQTRTLAAQLEQIAEAASKKEEAENLPDENAPPKSVQIAAPILPPTLPFAFTPFFGRETEKKEIAALLSPHSPEVRQVTLTGAGGSGKTRLATEVARALLPAYAGAVIFVPLMEMRDARRVWEAIARALRLPHSVTGQYQEAVIAALSALSAALLVLDGFEQIAADGGPVVLSLLHTVPGLQILVTSRRRLEIAGERTFFVAPLPVPDSAEFDGEDLEPWPAIQLFINRAQAAQSDFAVTPRNAQSIAELVGALEGIPLALELAAARIRTVGVAQMHDQLRAPSENGDTGRFSLLTARHTNETDRHRSLWATISWSFEQLPPPLRGFFTRLSVFRNGWTTQAAQSVCNEPFAAEYLTQLRAHSLLTTAQSENSEPRFVLLDSLREFAAEQLTESEKAETMERHGAYFGRMALDSESGLKGEGQQEWLHKLDTDYENICAVLMRGGLTSLHLVGSLRRYWQVHGPLRASVEIAETLMQAVPADPDVNSAQSRARAAALGTMGSLYLRLGDYPLTQACLEEAFGLYQAQNNEAEMASVLGNRGTLWARQGDLLAGQAAQKESLEIRLRLGDKWGAAASYLNLGAVTYDLGDIPAAGMLYEQSLRLSQEIGDTGGVGAALSNLANVAAASGNRDLARTRYEECVAIARRQNNFHRLGIALINLGGLLLGDPSTLAQAEAHFDEAYRLYQKTGDQGAVGVAIKELAEIAIGQKNFPLAHARLLEGLALPLTRLHLCLVGEAFAALFMETHDPKRAVTFYSFADALRAASRLPHQSPAHDALINERLETLRATLGDFAACWEHGQTLSRDDARTLAQQPLPKKEKPE